jgi:hypothetical protein
MRHRQREQQKVTILDGVAVRRVDTRPSLTTILGILRSDNHDLEMSDFITAESLTAMDGLEIDIADSRELIKKVADSQKDATAPEEGLSVTDAVRAIGRVDQGVNEIYYRQRDAIQQLQEHEASWDDAAWGKGMDDADEDISFHLANMEEKLKEVMSRLAVNDDDKEDSTAWRVKNSSKSQRLLDNEVIQDV